MPTTRHQPCSATPSLEGRFVSDVVVRLPKTMGPRATCGEVRAAFGDDHVHMVLLTDHGQLLGTLVPADLPHPGSDDDRALSYARLDKRTVSPDFPAEAARQLLLATGQRRLAVVDDAGRLIGLLCLKRRLTGFCSDHDVLARAAQTANLNAQA
jgi:CBS domain-containing protein